ncbi:MAG: ABC transporter permease [Peptococcaceae bacterium]|jgi:simple sugar transport system permease protein|nr:ABC transporter permease [Peptococcaceae bacterium]
MKISRKLLLPLISLCALIASLIIGAIIILINGDNPLVAYGALIEGSFNGMPNLAGTLSSATPLLFTGLGVAVAFKSGMANIGAEGQLYMGAIAAALVGVYLPWPGISLIPAALLAAFAAGGLYGLIPAALKIKTDTNEVVTTLMLNYVATLLTSYLVNYPFKAPGAPLGMTEDIQKAARLPLLYSGSRFNIGFILAIAACVLVALMFRYTTMGYEMRMLGQNSVYSKYIGIDVSARMLQGMFLGGGLAGVGGATLVLGIQYRFVQNISPGYGFDGLTIALMAGFSAIGVIPMAILFGALRSGGLSMELATSVPSELSKVVQAIIILFMAAQVSLALYFTEFMTRLRHRREKKQATGGA